MSDFYYYQRSLVNKSITENREQTYFQFFESDKCFASPSRFYKIFDEAFLVWEVRHGSSLIRKNVLVRELIVFEIKKWLFTRQVHSKYTQAFFYVR